MDTPNICMATKVPTSEMGTTILGIAVYRQFCKKTNITINTNTMASSSVCTTCWMETDTNLELSYGADHSTPLGR